MFLETILRLLWLATLAVGVLAAPNGTKKAPPNGTKKAPPLLQSYEGYAPRLVSCPRTSLVRPAFGLSSQESAYVYRRKQGASRALRSWLSNIDDAFELRKVPTLALASSGGGYRAMLLGAGIVQAFDEQDSDEVTNGLYQALTYHAGLSGGAWLLSSLIGNKGDAAVSTLKELWDAGLVKNSIYPTNTGTAPEGPQIKVDIAAKQAAGFTTTVTDVWARFLSYQLLEGKDGGVATRLSNVLNIRGLWGARTPYPIITALAKTGGIDGANCDPEDNAVQMEFTPYEMGSWDKGISAFTPTAYLGTEVANGRPQKGRCYQNFDNLGYVLGTSSSKFQESCGTSDISLISSFLTPLLPAATNKSPKRALDPARVGLYAPYKNPFYKSPTSPLVSSDAELFLVDGGQANQNNPIWPFLQPHRFVDVVFVNDNSADTDDNYPNGTEILHTYVQAKAAGLTKMPSIPSVSDFMSTGIYKRAAFFGCQDKSKITIVWLPNAPYGGFASNLPSSKFEYTANETAAMIGNGNQIATQGGDKEWPVCLGCAIMHKTSTKLPKQCEACLKKYCA